MAFLLLALGCLLVLGLPSLPPYRSWHCRRWHTHLHLLVCQGDEMYLRCGQCGLRSPGLRVPNRRPTATKDPAWSPFWWRKFPEKTYADQLKPGGKPPAELWAWRRRGSNVIMWRTWRRVR